MLAVYFPNDRSSFLLKTLLRSLMQSTLSSSSTMRRRLNWLRFSSCLWISLARLFKASSLGFIAKPGFSICCLYLSSLNPSFSHLFSQARQDASSPNTFQPKLWSTFSSLSFLRQFLFIQSLLLSSPFAWSSFSDCCLLYSYSFLFNIFLQFMSFSLISSSTAAFEFCTFASFIFNFKSKNASTFFSPKRSLSFADIFASVTSSTSSLSYLSSAFFWRVFSSFSIYNIFSCFRSSLRSFSHFSSFLLQLQASFGSIPSEINFLIKCWSLIISYLLARIFSWADFWKGSKVRKLLKSPIYPQPTTMTGTLGLSFLSVGTLAICLSTSIPSISWPKTTCLSSNYGHALSVTKNWLELVFRPQFAMESMPALECFLAKFSSLKVLPQMEQPPVPSPFVMSPP